MTQRAGRFAIYTMCPFKRDLRAFLRQRSPGLYSKWMRGETFTLPGDVQFFEPRGLGAIVPDPFRFLVTLFVEMSLDTAVAPEGPSGNPRYASRRDPFLRLGPGVVAPVLHAIGTWTEERAGLLSSACAEIGAAWALDHSRFLGGSEVERVLKNLAHSGLIAHSGHRTVDIKEAVLDATGVPAGKGWRCALDTFRRGGFDR